MRTYKKLNYLLVFVVSLFSFLVFNANVMARPVIESAEVINYKDVVRIKVSNPGSGISGYYIGSVNDVKKANFIATNATDINLSLMNGLQYIWAKDTQGDISDPYTVTLQNSCIEEAVPKNATGEGTFKKCAVYTSGSYLLVNNESVEGVCASGYSLEYMNTANVCRTLTSNDLSKYKVGYRYCQISFTYKCSKNDGNNNPSGGNGGTSTPKVTSYLNSLNISSGTLSPAFKATTYKYNASVNVSAITINASLNGDGSSFVDGYGPKTFNLKYGLNTIYIKVKSKTGNITTYILNITRVDNRNTDNTLATLSTDVGALTPAFNKGIAMYTVNVGKNVSKATVNATLSNAKSSFVDGYGPRTVDLNSGENKIEIKIKSEAGATKTYVINVIKEGAAAADLENVSLLSSLELSSGNIEFKEKVFEYTVYVPYDVTQIITTAKAKNEADKVTITGGENLEVGVEKPVVVTVYNENTKHTKTYTINVIRKEENLDVSSNSKLSSLKIDKHSIDFSSDKTEYELILRKGETELKIDAEADSEKSTVTIEGNEKLAKGSEVKIKVTAEDGSVTEYIIKITGVSKDANVFLIVILIILIIVIIGYMVLRLMGYKIYFNFSIIGSFFRSIGEKIKNIFDR